MPYAPYEASDSCMYVCMYVNTAGTAVVRFLNFMKNVGHKREEMEKCVIELFEKYGIDLKDCRGQSYDKAKNMSGITGFR
jgi:hypothetical protein